MDWYAEDDIYVYEEEEEDDEDEHDEDEERVHQDDVTPSQRSWITSDTPSEVFDPKEVQEWDEKLDDDNWFQELTQEYEANLEKIQQENIDETEGENEEEPWDW